jgi:hypothetical protein
VSGDSSAVPAEQRVGGDDPAGASWAGERGGDGTEQGPITVVDFESVDLAADDGELVAEHDDLEVLGATGTEGKTGQSGYEAIGNAKHRWSASAVFPLISAHGRVFGPHRIGRVSPGQRQGRIFGPHRPRVRSGGR